MKFIKVKKLLKVLSVMGFCILSSAHATTSTHNLNSNEVLIFVSFSMPIKSLQAWSAQAQKIQAPLVIRGLVNDSFSDTQKAVKQMIGDGNGGVVIDPRLFQQYHITQVPAVLVRETDHNTCLPSQSCWHPETTDVIFGDIGLENALKIIADHGDNVDTAQRFLMAWRPV